jgi:hypothetical protein
VGIANASALCVRDLRDLAVPLRFAADAMTKEVSAERPRKSGLDDSEIDDPPTGVGVVARAEGPD